MICSSLRTRRSSLARLAGAALGLLAAAAALPLVGCDGGASDKSDDKAADEPDDDGKEKQRQPRDEGAREEARGAAAPSASAPTSVASGAGSGASSATLPPLPVREVPAGNVVGGPWLGKFKVGRASDKAGLGWSDARTACVQQGMDLCSDTQWQRACEVDAAVGQAASWTFSSTDAAGFVVRGGGGECSTRTVVAGASASPDRIGLCCERTIAITTLNTNPAFLLAVSTKLLAYERALNAHSVPAVSALLDARLGTFFTMKDVDRAAAEKKFEGAFRAQPTEAALHGTCRVTLDLVGDPEKDKWVAECDKLLDRTSEVAVVLARYEFGGPDTKLRYIAEPKLLRGWGAP